MSAIVVFDSECFALCLLRHKKSISLQSVNEPSLIILALKVKIVFLILLAGFAPKLAGQTQLKANAAYWVLGVTNLSVETAIGSNLTFNGDVVYSPWKSISGNHLQICQLIPEVRYYPKGAFEKFYVGGYASFHFFNMTKWNYINKDKYQKGRGYALGVVIGFQTPISDRWRLDLYAGGGWQHSQYRGYDGKTGEQYVGWNGSGEWLPYKLGVAFAYRLGRK